MIAGQANTLIHLGLEEVARLPVTQISTAFLTDRGTHAASFEGPLLCTMLQKAGAIDPKSMTN